ncbi:hypothetical protein FACS189451_04430 [Bacteroidia bacterium]|nr:hypothetical protein FACS189451_04430 [Bacteroidia bacterium]
MKKFYLYPHIYYSANASNEILLYNTKTGAVIENNFPACRQLIEDIYDPEKLGVIDFSEKYLNSNEVVEFVKQLTEENFGQLIDFKPGIPQLVNLLPILNLQDDVERLEKDKESDIGEKAIQYLNELNIYLNSQCSLNCPHCDLYFKQTKSCFKETENVNIQTHKIKKILDGLAYSSLKKVNFLGGNILLYPYLNELTDIYRFQYFIF